MAEIVYLNGAFVPKSEAKIPAMDYGFLYGYGLFETMRAYGGTVFRLDSHLARLKKSADRLGIAVEAAELSNAVKGTLLKNRLKDARIRLTVSIGEGGMVPDPSSCTKTTVLVAAARYVPYPPEVYRKGFRLIVSSIRRNSQSPLPCMKTANYLENMLARQEAKAAGVDDALLLNEKGQIAEASASNFFLVSGNTLKTPPPESGILPGITRDVILELAKQLGVKAIEADSHMEELSTADESFLTNSIIEVMPVISIDRRTVGSGKPGTITVKLMTAYKDLVLKETL